MIDLLGIGAGAFAVTFIAYKYGTMKSKTSEGCNGHHWGEPTREVSDDLLTYPEYVGEPDLEHLHAEPQSDGVKLEVDAVRRCEDCRERRVTTVKVGRVPYEAFRDYE